MKQYFSYLSRLSAVALLFAIAIAIAGGAAHAATRGADTDLFAASNSSSTGAANIIFLVDNGADFSKSASETCNIDSSGNVVTTAGVTTNATALSGTSGGLMQCGIYAALSSLVAGSTASVNIAVMMFNTNGIKTFNPTTSTFSSDCSGGNGGCVVLPLTGFTTSTKPAILSWVKAWENSGNGNYNIKGPATGANGAVMQEAWAFYQGKTGVSGRTYTAPTIGCGKNFVVFVGNAWSNNSSPGDQTGAAGPKNPLFGLSSTTTQNANPAATTSEKTLFSGTQPAKYVITTTSGSTTTNTALICTGSGGSTSVTYTSTDTENSGAYGLNWAKYMWNQATIKTYSVGLLGPTCNPLYSTWLDLLADNGSGQFFPTNDYATLKAALQTVLSQIISVNSVFASVSLPVSVNTQGSYLNQVYIGMFRPDPDFLPKWLGNLKQYKLAFIGANLKLVDADGTAAINTNTGFITECARSFWTPTATDTYWAQNANGDCTTVSGAKASNTPDGNIVEKGAHAYMLRTTTPSSRVVKTCAMAFADCTSLTNFTTTTTTGTGMGSVAASSLSAPDTATMNTYIDWARGLNNHAEGAVELNQAAAAMRASVHGDVMHSRPVAINYNTDASPQVVVYYGANDGMLHAINGNQTTDLTAGAATYSPGTELWSFMPPEFYSSVQRQYNNTTQVYYYGASSSAVDKYYGMDGPFTAFRGTLSGATKTYLFATMRRGGRAVYAFDVTTPASPSLLWKAGCTSTTPSTMMSSTDCATGFSNIGQTWGSAKIFYSSIYGSGATPLLLMAGGYDTCEDTDTGTANHLCSGASTKGSNVYIIDGTNGTVVTSFATDNPWSGGTKRGVIGDATIVNGSDGKAKYAYIADMGGVVYRIDMSGNSTGSWRMDAIAKLGCSSPASACTANRKFMFQPSVVSTDGVTFWILVGSGDREKPVYGHVASRGVSNYFFAIKDEPATSVTSYMAGEQSTCGEKVVCLASLQLIDGSTGTATDATLAAISSKKGWYLSLSSTEQVVTSALTQFGNTTFSTHTPTSSSNSCTPSLGSTRVYNVSYLNAASNNGTSNRYEHVAGDGLPPSPVAGKVVIDGTSVPFCIGCSKDSPLEGKKATALTTVSRARSRLYWYLEKN